MSRNVSILNRMIARAKNRERDPLSPLIDVYMLKRHLSEDRLPEYNVPLIPRLRPPGRISPSTIGGCERQAVFVFLGVKGKRKVDPDQEMIFEDGNWRHHKWDAIFLDMERVLGPDVFRVVAIEKRVAIPDLFIEGSFDVHVVIYGVHYVIDIKGINRRGFEWVYTRDEPNESHVDQVATYCKARKVKRGLILYECKDDNRRLVIPVNYSSDMWERVRQWSKNVVRHMREEELPPKHEDCQGGTYLFERCAFSSFCWGSKTYAQVRDLAYHDFVSVEVQWKRGQRERRGTTGTKP